MHHTYCLCSSCKSERRRNAVLSAFGWALVAIAALAVILLTARKVSADTGFRLPPGTTSDCKNFCAPPTPPIRLDLPVDSTLARYGTPKPGSQVDIGGNGPTLHAAECETALTNVCKNDPGWFAANGYGDASGRDCQWTQTEALDCYFTAACGKPGRAVFKRSTELTGQMITIDPCAVPAGPRDLCGNCGDGKLEPGEDCAHCPWDQRDGACASPAPVAPICATPTDRQPWPVASTTPPPNPTPGSCIAPKVCIDPPAACTVCAPPTAPLAQCDVLALQTVPQSVRDDCSRAKTYPLGAGQAATIRRICAALGQVKQFLPGTDSTASLRLVKVNAECRVTP